jgi:hypothetical protein
MDTSNFGFDPTKFTNAPLQTEGWVRFTDPPAKVFARLANHEGLTEWVPLLEKVTVTHPQPLASAASGESTVGTTRTLVFKGGLTLVEHVVYWNPPLCYAYDTQGKVLPVQNYIGMMGVEATEDGGGTFIFREYFAVGGLIKETVIPHGVVLPMKRALDKLSRLIGGTEYDVRHVNAPD